MPQPPRRDRNSSLFVGGQLRLLTLLITHTSNSAPFLDHLQINLDELLNGQVNRH